MSTTLDVNGLGMAAITLAEQAGRAILEVYAGDFSVTTRPIAAR